MVEFVRVGEQQERDLYIRNNCKPLFRSGVFYDGGGDIYYRIRPTIALQRALSPEFVQLTRLSDQADIQAPYTQFTNIRLRQTHRIEKDEGSVEAAIRSMGHVLERELEVELPQARTVQERASSLLNLFTTGFDQITDVEFRQARRETYDLLGRVGLDPSTVVDNKKRSMAAWITKASFGKDSQDRRNKLISVLSLRAAYRVAIERQQGIGEILSKFIKMHEALLYEREFSRAVMIDVVDRLKPAAVSSHYLFKRPSAQERRGDAGILISMLKHLEFQLGLPRLRPYRPASLDGQTSIAQVRELLEGGRRLEVAESGLFEDAATQVEGCLNWYSEIYPEQTRSINV